jgi:predicted Co/Zn/Cd cation transporter (cation efflux family)
MDMDREGIKFVALYILLIAFVIGVGSLTVASLYNVLQNAFPSMRNTVFGFNVVIAFASFFVIIVLNFYLRLLNKMITGEFYKRIGARGWVRSALSENRKIILGFMLISAIITINRSEKT